MTIALHVAHACPNVLLMQLQKGIFTKLMMSPAQTAAHAKKFARQMPYMLINGMCKAK
jgi:hypothetical protein